MYCSGETTETPFILDNLFSSIREVVEILLMNIKNRVNQNFILMICEDVKYFLHTIFFDAERHLRL